MTCQFIAGEPSRDDSCKCSLATPFLSAWCEKHYRVVYRPADGVKRLKPAVKPCKPRSPRPHNSLAPRIRLLLALNMTAREIACLLDTTQDYVRAVRSRVRRGTND